jgi:uncharacterized protein YdeI (YjbR/CyaY-like superfamily)
MYDSMNPNVDFYFSKAGKWQEEIGRLRTIVLDCGLTEELKWGVPCYTLHDAKQKRNIVLIHVFRDYCALLFFKGALLNNVHGILVRQTENVQSARQIRFTGMQQVIELEPAVKAYIHEAVAVERSGLKVALKKHTELVFPEELQRLLNDDPGFRTAFEALTPGRQRAYNLYFSAPKQSKTRELRIEKHLQRIRDEKGLNDA